MFFILIFVVVFFQLNSKRSEYKIYRKHFVFPLFWLEYNVFYQQTTIVLWPYCYWLIWTQNIINIYMRKTCVITLKPNSNELIMSTTGMWLTRSRAYMHKNFWFKWFNFFNCVNFVIALIFKFIFWYMYIIMMSGYFLQRQFLFC